MMEYKVKNPNPNYQLIFNNDKNSWVMKITQEGIIFNRESFPYVNADGFAKSVIEILESCYEVRFTEKMDKVTWIPCTERLPEDGGQKLCTHFCDTCEAMKSSYLVWAAPYNDGWCCDERVTGKVTHWMPIPLPPKQIS